MTNREQPAEPKLYADRDHVALGNHYVRHVSAMTAEGLHAKSDIAGELAWRDWQIVCLRDALERADAALATQGAPKAEAPADQTEPALKLAEQVLAMGLATPRGIRARERAREVLRSRDALLQALRLIQHATSPAPDDGGFHEAAYDIATDALSLAHAQRPAPGANIHGIGPDVGGGPNPHYVPDDEPTQRPAGPATPDLRAVLAELVACKDLKKEAGTYLAAGPWTDSDAHRAAVAEYERRQPLAWEAARAALAHAQRPAPDLSRGTDDELVEALNRCQAENEALRNRDDRTITARCNACNRASWSGRAAGTQCLFTQPNGSVCPGEFRAAQRPAGPATPVSVRERIEALPVIGTSMANNRRRNLIDRDEVCRILDEGKS